MTQDGRTIAVRTYSTAFEWSVPADGNLTTAFASAPTKIPLLASRQGEALAYSRDQKSLFTTSEGSGTDNSNPPGGVIDRYDSLVSAAASLPEGPVVGFAAAASGAIFLVAVVTRRRRLHPDRRDLRSARTLVRGRGGKSRLAWRYHPIPAYRCCQRLLHIAQRRLVRSVAPTVTERARPPS